VGETPGLLTKNPAEENKAISTSPSAPKSIPLEGGNAILPAAHRGNDKRICLRNEALLELLIYADLRAQQVCDLDRAGGNVTIRHAKGNRMLRRCLTRLRRSQRLPAIGSDVEQFDEWC
jgi:site-specific recombinase XerC